MLQNKIYHNYIIEIFKLFLVILFSLAIIAWTVRAVNFLDLIVESGYPVFTYFHYSFLNLFGILTKFIPLSFLLALSIFIIRQLQENELIILWTSGVKKIQVIHLFLFLSLFISLFHLIFSVFITPTALNKSRKLLGNEKIISILPTLKIQQFSDSFKGLTFIVDDKFENQIKNIFLHDKSNILKNISSDRESKTSSTIIAKTGIVEEKKLVLFNGLIISESKGSTQNDIIKFEQIDIDLRNLENTTIKQPKIQETSTLRLFSCIYNKFSKDPICKGGFNEEILPTLNRRMVLPLFIPVITLISSLLFIKTSGKIYYSKVSIFAYSFLVLLYAELTIRYTGINEIIKNVFLFSPAALAIFIYIFLKIKLSQETKNL